MIIIVDEPAISLFRLSQDERLSRLVLFCHGLCAGGRPAGGAAPLEARSLRSENSVYFLSYDSESC